MTNETDLKTLSETDESGFVRPEKLAMVHVTNYMPQKVGDHFEIKSTAEATDYLYPRNTVHFTVGHHVASHMSGNWDGTGIMVVAPMKGIIDQNDKPLGVASMDTYFETTPGHNLVLPQDTQIFVPASQEKELDGKLSLTEGNLTYYKSTNFTDEEKKKIFEKARFPYLFDEESIYMSNGQKVSEEDLPYLPDDFFAFQLKKNLLREFIEEKGYVSDQYNKFGLEGSRGAKSVCELGEHLGCRFYSSGNKGHYWSDFNTNIVNNLYNVQYWAEFIFDSDSYSISDRRLISPKYQEYTFIKKGERKGRDLVSSSDRCLDETIDVLKSGYDYTQELNAENQEDKEMLPWSPAYRATYDVWREKTLKRLSAFYKKAKSFNFEEWQKKLDQKIYAFDKAHPQKLLSDAPRPLDSERDKKSSKLLHLLRERDRAGKKMTVGAFQKQKESQK